MENIDTTNMKKLDIKDNELDLDVYIDDIHITDIQEDIFNLIFDSFIQNILNNMPKRKPKKVKTR